MYKDCGRLLNMVPLDELEEVVSLNKGELLSENIAYDGTEASSYQNLS